MPDSMSSFQFNSSPLHRHVMVKAFNLTVTVSFSSKDGQCANRNFHCRVFLKTPNQFLLQFLTKMFSMEIYLDF